MYRKMIIQAGPERFAGYLNGELVGEKPTRLEAEQMLDGVIYELCNPRPVRQREYRIAWQSKATGREEFGAWFPESEHAWLIGQMRWANQEWPDVDHWIEERDPTTTTRPQAAPTEEAPDA